LNEANEKAIELAKKYPKIAGSVGNPVSFTTGAQTLADTSSSLLGGGGMGNINIEVNAGLGASGIQVGQEIDQYLREYLGFTGKEFSFGSVGTL
jgi:hypothetical protein